jgi:lysyl-tRNA synthetase class 1
MHWADELVKTILNKKTIHRVDDMKTVSGMPHVGSLRAVTTHDIVYKAMKDAGFNVVFSYVFNDMDPMDGLPVYLDEKEYRQHMGKPLYKIPSPEKGYESFGKYYATKYKEAFNKIGCNPEIVWSHELYASGKMDAIVRLALDHSEDITKIYKKVAGQIKPKDWLPYQVICPKCGKVGSTLVTDWDGEYVKYECKRDLVEWAVGCGHQGKVKPVRENGKLMWKVDWPAHWKALNITVEGAGKEHFTEGGSRDIGVHICKEVFKTKPPFGFLHEFFLIGGRKMSSSKGSGIGADKITEIIPPELVRFLIVKTPLRRAVDFNPEGMTIPSLFDHYDQAAKAYFDKSNTKLSRIYELSQVDEKRVQNNFLPRFRDVAKFIQDPKVNTVNEFELQKGSKLTQTELNLLEERIEYAKIWLANYAPETQRFSVTKKVTNEFLKFTEPQLEYLSEIKKLLDKPWTDPNELQQVLYDTAKEMDLSPKSAFQAIYIALIGKDHGPKAAWLLMENKSESLKRLKEIIQ